MTPEQFYGFNLRFIYLVAVANIFESMVLIKLYASFYDGNFKGKRANSLLLVFVALIASVSVELVVGYIVEDRVFLSLYNLFWNSIYLILFGINYKFLVEAYANLDSKVYAIVLTLVFLVYFIAVMLLVGLKYDGPAWIVAYPLSTTLILVSNSFWMHKEE
jgi:hypothetical protein